MRSSKQGWASGTARLPNKDGPQPSGGQADAAGPSDSDSTSDLAKARFIINVVSNGSWFVLKSVVMAWFIPVLVSHLGVAAYGMIPLASSLAVWAGVFSTGLDVATNRFLAIELNRGNKIAANRTFNTALALSLAACAILLGPSVLVSYHFPMIFDVPAGLEGASKVFFASVAVWMMGTIIGNAFGAASLSMHRFDLYNLVSALSLLSRVGVVVLCFTIENASLFHVALGFIVSALIGLAGNVFVWKWIAPQLHINFREIDRQQLRSLVVLSGWMSISTLGYALLSADLLVVNAVFGAGQTGSYGAVLFFPTLIYALTEIFVTVLNPALMARYAVGDIEGMRRIARRSVKLAGIGLAMPAGVLCGLAGPLLTVWLGPEFAELQIVLVLLTGHLAANLAIYPLVHTLTAYNRVKVQAVVTLALGLTNLALSVGLARWSGWGVAGIAAASAFVLTIRNSLFLSIYSSRVIGLNWWALSKPLVVATASTACVALACALASMIWPPTSWLKLATLGGSVSVIYIIAAYYLLLSLEDTEFLRDILYTALMRNWRRGGGDA